MRERPLVVRAVGDLIVDRPQPSRFFAPAAPVLRAADLAIGHVEVPHSTTDQVTSTDVPAPPADPAHLRAVADAGFGVVTLAGNHISDSGATGVSDTIDAARSFGMLTAGAGADLDEARRPATVQRFDRSIGVVSYNCVGPRESWATSRKAGCAYVDVLTHYEMRNANPGGPPRIRTFCEPTSLRAFRDEIAEAASRVDVLVVALHKGLVHTPAVLADYEREVSRAAIDAGADAVIGHHAHILRGVEVYRERPIFHGLGNFVTVTDALTPNHGSSTEASEWAAQRRELFGFVPDPAMPTYPFHPDSRNTMIAQIEFTDGPPAASFIPCWIDDDARPVPHGADERGRAVAEYVRMISARAGLPTRYEWDGDVVRISRAG
jgi:poly-gamma-glutamate synthesis protein (capsule biosynthesis protein)